MSRLSVDADARKGTDETEPRLSADLRFSLPISARNGWMRAGSPASGQGGEGAHDEKSIPLRSADRSFT